MNIHDYITNLFPKTINYNLARYGYAKPAAPITLTFSVTAACQSLCRTCQIGKVYRDDPDRVKNDLQIDEIEKIFRTIKSVYFFNISGGEPFLRKDLPEIISLALKYLGPKIVHIPTNAIATNRIMQMTVEILDIIVRKAPQVPLTIKPSIDGVGDTHDVIRGVKGNFKQLQKTIAGLKEIAQQYPSLHVELGTVVSVFNMDNLDAIEDFVHQQGVESYRNEIAEQREEFFNVGDPITPTGDQYEKLMASFKRKIRANLRNKQQLARITESFRLVYYDLVSEIMRKKSQVIPCLGGISNVHLNYDGTLWPCCVLGYRKPLGNLRNAGYDFGRIWHSQKSRQVREYIRQGNCWCPLANQAYSNILCHYPSLAKVLKNIHHV